MIPDQYKDVVSQPVYIRKHVITASTSVILLGVDVKEESSFGAFAFINRNPESWSMNVGIPFKRINNRSNNVLKLEKN